ncbi:hypothetical protein ml_507 [Mollivirus sibericum]|uniref:hypothetical protein n=1 Tax=Mollivirus sibericum TaxID=1678078 RepID=UPI0006B2E2D6|nr:hypothetical protein ml_507 [Mollivirus sibericum]ALD62309.1 hypothetical protein ml_507 [Mollivirus sibericum]
MYPVARAEVRQIVSATLDEALAGGRRFSHGAWFKAVCAKLEEHEKGLSMWDRNIDLSYWAQEMVAPELVARGLYRQAIEAIGICKYQSRPELTFNEALELVFAFAKRGEDEPSGLALMLDRKIVKSAKYTARKDFNITDMWGALARSGLVESTNALVEACAISTKGDSWMAPEVAKALNENRTRCPRWIEEAYKGKDFMGILKAHRPDNEVIEEAVVLCLSEGDYDLADQVVELSLTTLGSFGTSSDFLSLSLSKARDPVKVLAWVDANNCQVDQDDIWELLNKKPKSALVLSLVVGRWPDRVLEESASVRRLLWRLVKQRDWIELDKALASLKTIRLDPSWQPRGNSIWSKCEAKKRFVDLAKLVERSDAQEWLVWCGTPSPISASAEHKAILVLAAKGLLA